MSQDSTLLNKIIAQRRSIYPKSYTEGTIDSHVINQILQNANLAPSHKRTYPWRFVVFSGDGLQLFATWQSELYKKVSKENGNFVEKKYKKLKSQPLKCSHVISVLMERDPEKRVPEIEEISSVACAVQNMYLTAAAYGVGMYWGTGGVTYFDEAKEFFDLGEDDKIMGFLYLGLVNPEDWPADKGRSEWEEAVKWVDTLNT